MLEYLNKVTILGLWFRETDLGLLHQVVLALLLAINLSLTLIHSIQELKGRLWRYFGGIAGIRIPDAVGFPTFFLGLTLLLWAVGFVAITGYVPLIGFSQGAALGCVGALIGARLSDSLHSHFLLDRQGFRPNPGLGSTSFYLAEAVILTILFLPGLRARWIPAAFGFLAAWAFFSSILPFLRLAREVVPWLRRPCVEP